MTEDELNSLEALARNATTGPWKVECGDHAGDDWLIASLGYTDEAPAGNRQVTTDRVRASQYFGEADGDAKFIVAARKAVPALVEEVRKLRAAISDVIGFAEVLDYWIQPLPGMQEVFREDMGAYRELQTRLASLVNKEPA